MRKNRLLLILFTLVLPLALTACLHDDDDDDDPTCDSPGPGAQPLSGSGSESSPYVISLDIAYGVNENLLIVIDEKIAGFDESGTFSVDAGTYYIEVFSNSSDSSFTLEVEVDV